jgi:putative membrane protein (TIGR04086 family)
MPRHGKKGNSNLVPQNLFSPLAVLGGLGIALLTGLVGALLVAIVFFAGNIKTPMEPTLRIFTYLTVFIGGIFAGKHSQRIGWFHGFLVGFLYFSALFWVAGGLQVFSDSFWVGRGVLCTTLSLVGGCIGANFRSAK